ncbi:MAG: serine hydrolase domain-containing protein [Fusobacteriota bacterium]
MDNKILESFIEKTKDIQLNGIVILKDGEKVAQHQWRPEARQNQYSISKSFTSTAVGLAVEEGILNLEELVVDCFPDEIPENPSENLLKLKVRDLLTMGLGQDRPHMMGSERASLGNKNWVKYCLNRPFSKKPGSKFRYSNAGPYLAGVIIQKRVGMNLVDYLMPRLFTPLGIYLPTWELDPQGKTFGSSGLYLTVSEIAKFGQLYLQEGIWEGKQLIPKSWVKEATKEQIKTGRKDPDKAGYGYLFWRGKHNSYRADGKYGQYSIVIPDKNAVVAINSYNIKDKPVRKHIWSEIYPKL